MSYGIFKVETKLVSIERVLYCPRTGRIQHRARHLVRVHRRGVSSMAQEQRRILRFRRAPDFNGKRGRDNGSVVQSLTRALGLLEVLAEDDEGYRLVDLAQRAGLSPSTTHRLLTTLEQKRFVQFDRENGLWHVGVQCFSVGANFLRRRDFVTQALPFMRHLRDAVGETVNLGVEDQGEVVFLTQAESREMMRAITRPGG